MPEVRTTSSTGGQKGVKLARFDLIPARPLWLLAEHYGKGAKKYAEHQWRQGFEWGKAIGALERHMAYFKMGIDYDLCRYEPDNCLQVHEGKEWEGEIDTCWNHTGSHHMQAVMWMSFCLMEFIDDPQYAEHDDRWHKSDEYEKMDQAARDLEKQPCPEHVREKPGEIHHWSDDGTVKLCVPYPEGKR